MLKMILLLIATLIAVAAGQEYLNGLQIDSSADGSIVYLDGISYAIAGYTEAPNGTITLILEPCDEDGQYFEDDSNPSKDPRIGPGQKFLYKKPGVLVTVGGGFDPEPELDG